MKYSLIFNEREESGNKGDYGKVLVVAGSKGMMGAATLTCEAAIRSGAGTVVASVPEEYFSVIHGRVPQATCIGRNLGYFTEESLEKFNGIVIGPGLSMGIEGGKILFNILKNYSGPLVIDADGLNLIAKHNMTEYVKKYRGQIIITPHLAEAERLLGRRLGYEKIKVPRKEWANELSNKYKVITLLKGKNTIVHQNNNFYVNQSGNVGMATGGSGDVLSGILVSFLALWDKGQVKEAIYATAYGTFVHGLAGDLAAEDKGVVGMTATDILENIPYAIKKTREPAGKSQEVRNKVRNAATTSQENPPVSMPRTIK